MKRPIFIIKIILIAVMATSSFAFSPTNILEKVDEIRAPAKTFIFDLKAIVKNAEAEEETVQEFTVRIKDARKSLVLYKSPSSYKGRVLLMVGDNMWIYIPGTRKPIRISPEQQLMGRISNADVARVVYELDYTVEAIMDEIIEDKEATKLLLKKKTKGAAYNTINLWVQKNSLKPIKAEFFAISNRLLKTVYYREYKEILGMERPMILEIHDNIKDSEICILEYSNIRLEHTPDSYYQKTYMHRLR